MAGARRPGVRRRPAPWLAVTGTNGKTTTVGMLESVLRAAGEAVAAVGNVGTPVVLAAVDPSVDVLVVELSSFQLHFTHSMSAQAAAVLNVAADHLDWHGSLEAYAADKGRIFERAQVACVYNLADARTEDLVREADVVDGAVAVGFTLGTPLVGQVGLVEDVLVDRGFSRLRHARRRARHARRPGAPGGTRRDRAAARRRERPRRRRAGPRARGRARHGACRAARLRRRRAPPGDGRDDRRHRVRRRLEGDQRPRCCGCSGAFAPGSVVWVAGGLAKGARFDELVAARKDRLAGVVLIGVDREPLREALARHAPEVPVVEVDAGETDAVMTRAVHEARRLAVGAGRPVTVLLAPACASMDQFTSYAARGEEFAAAVRALGEDV